MGFTKIGIFWLAFGAFLVPVFTIALICSIVKAVRTRRNIKRRKRERQHGGPKDAEIVTKVRHKIKIEFIEDVKRRKEFRSSRGSLFFPSRSNLSPKTVRRKLDIDVDGNPNSGYDVNKSNVHHVDDNNVTTNNSLPPTLSYESNNVSDGRSHDEDNITTGNVTVNGTVISSNRLALPTLSNGSNNVSFGSTTNNGIVSNNINNHNNNNNHNHYNNVNGAPNGRKYTKGGGGGGSSSSNRRRRSLDSQYPSYISQNHNGHIIPEHACDGDEKDAIVMSSISRRRLDPNQGLIKPHSNRSRRHSMNSTTSILERIPEACVTEVEINNIRSRSEDHLVVDPNAFSSPSLTGHSQGADNKGFARSTETTIM